MYGGDVIIVIGWFDEYVKCVANEAFVRRRARGNVVRGDVDIVFMVFGR